MYSSLVQFYLYNFYYIYLLAYIPYFAPFNFQSSEFLRVLPFPGWVLLV